jgi:hypothetical protein
VQDVLNRLQNFTRAIWFLDENIDPLLIKLIDGFALTPPAHCDYLHIRFLAPDIPEHFDSGTCGEGGIRTPDRVLAL